MHITPRRGHGPSKVRCTVALLPGAAPAVRLQLCSARAAAGRERERAGAETQLSAGDRGKLPSRCNAPCRVARRLAARHEAMPRHATSCHVVPRYVAAPCVGVILYSITPRRAAPRHSSVHRLLYTYIIYIYIYMYAQCGYTAAQSWLSPGLLLNRTAARMGHLCLHRYVDVYYDYPLHVGMLDTHMCKQQCDMIEGCTAVAGVAVAVAVAVPEKTRPNRGRAAAEGLTRPPRRRPPRPRVGGTPGEARSFAQASRQALGLRVGRVRAPREACGTESKHMRLPGLGGVAVEGPCLPGPLELPPEGGADGDHQGQAWS